MLAFYGSQDFQGRFTAEIAQGLGGCVADVQVVAVADAQLAEAGRPSFPRARI